MSQKRKKNYKYKLTEEELFGVAKRFFVRGFKTAVNILNAVKVEEQADEVYSEYLNEKER